MKTGVIEIGLLIIGYLGLVIGKLKRDKLIKVLLLFSLVIIFFLIKPSEFIYKSFPLLGNIQHPWRMLSAFIFIPPIVLAYFLRKTNKNFIVYAIIFIICLSRFPQLYGKNYTIYPQSRYFFTTENLHGTVLNTVWTGPTNDYPIKKDKGEIIEGKGKIVLAQVRNNTRIYQVNSETELRMVDYTFYFPGWKVYVDGQPAAIEFQDPTYRGVITYQVPKGNHTIQVKFEDTKVRLVSKLISVITGALMLSGIIYLLITISNRKTQISKVQLKSQI